ncbi:universal stress protein [Streptomyces sp. S07_1.15]|uniref:universal stress protein n=1 Tax=Streptomyces sp. S07_1.15 TaxID=2873925 RepID=UPI001D13B27E|nr:universal stress protein [Streptomyces sp. S07_1.15]MCC3655430.1 universal stress protein [Streptomyces sp. S07_1.15]
MPRPVVAGLDGTRASFAAADWAAREALRRELPMTLVHAWSWEPVDLPVTRDEETQREAARRMLHEAAAGLEERYPDLDLTVEQPPAPAVAALLERSEDAEMLVLGTRGYGPLLGFLLGSVGLQVLGRAGGPVVMVRAAEDESDRPERRRDEVVAGLHQLTAGGEPVFAFAFAHAAAHGMRLRAVRAWSLPTVFNYSPAAMKLADESGGIEAHEKKLLHDALKPWRERYPEVEVVEHVDIGAAAEVLLSASARAGLMVVGRRGTPGRGRHLGPVAHATLHHAGCPVAVVAHD